MAFITMPHAGGEIRVEPTAGTATHDSMSVLRLRIGDDYSVFFRLDEAERVADEMKAVATRFRAALSQARGEAK